MPRKSRRVQAIELMNLHVLKLKKEHILRDVMDEEDSLEDIKYVKHKAVLDEMMSSRYLFRNPFYRKSDGGKFNIEDALSSTSVRYNDEEFLVNFRITRDSFFQLLDTIKDTKTFKKKSKTKQPRPIAYQLLV